MVDRRVVTRMILFVLALVLLAPAASGQARGVPARRHTPPPRPSPVTMHVAAGFDGQHRDSAWTPIRVTLHNRSAKDISGTVEVPGSNTMNGGGPPQPFHALYQTAVTLPAGSTKRVSLYVPGYSTSSAVDTYFRSGGRTLAHDTEYIASFNSGDLTVGALTTDPANSAWLGGLFPQNINTDLVRLSPATLDPVPDVLATFDVIVLADTGTSRLDHDQMVALERYVRNGGSLLLVGGPDWQETLRPLSSILPGRMAGSRELPDLHALRAIAPFTVSPHASQATTVSVLAGTRGTVAASEEGVPLVVRSTLGQGHVEYLAFDPALAPVAHWQDGAGLLGRLLITAAPQAASRFGIPQNYPQPLFGPYGPTDIGAELANVPAAALPSLVLFIILTALYILLLGPANFVVLRRLRRRELAWVTIPTLSLLCVGSTFGVAYHLKGSTVLLNTISMVTLDGSDGSQPAMMYVGLFAPVRGDYQLTYQGSALPEVVPQYTFYGPGPQTSNSPLGLRLDEGPQTGVTFVSMNMWSMRAVALHTTVAIRGTVQSTLHIAANGDLVGAIHNGTGLTLRRPVVLTGTGVTHLRDLPAGGTVSVHIRPASDIYTQTQQPLAFRLYGQPNFNGGGYFGRSTVISVFQGGSVFSSGGGSFSLCCPGPTPAPEKTLADRIRNAAAMLPETQEAASLGEVTLLGWTQASLGQLTVDGSAPQRRDLTLLATPLTVDGPAAGSFRLRTGTVGAHLVDLTPQASQNGCCGGPMFAGQSLDLGSGGSATFQFTIPHAAHLRFQHLTLWANAGGADGTDIGHVYDWGTRRWVHVDLSLGSADLPHPSRFIAPDGTLLLKLQATSSSGDVRIGNAYQDLQLSGSGTVVS